jgi:hypothetical protein
MVHSHGCRRRDYRKTHITEIELPAVSEEHQQIFSKLKNYWKMSRPKGTRKQIMIETSVQIDRMMSIFDDAGVEKQLTLAAES